jgi:murein DD-endopeptidase MepM/ murein hydrolase activator NlpD
MTWFMALLLLALGSTACAAASPSERPVAARIVPLPRPAAPRTGPTQHTRLSLPFEGTWIVGQGYHGAESHTGRAAYALDLVKVDADGRAHVRAGKRAKDWFGFGAAVLAAADGVVVRAIDRFADNRVMGTGTDTNTLIVQHAPSELSEYVHLQRGSLRVRVGERVRRGQVLARCGNSGSQTPHLHWALLSSLDPIRTRPATFSDYEIRDDQGAWQPTSGTPRSGDVIRQPPGAPTDRSATAPSARRSRSRRVGATAWRTRSRARRTRSAGESGVGRSSRD